MFYFLEHYFIVILLDLLDFLDMVSYLMDLLDFLNNLTGNTLQTSYASSTPKVKNLAHEYNFFIETIVKTVK